MIRRQQRNTPFPHTRPFRYMVRGEMSEKKKKGEKKRKREKKEKKEEEKKKKGEKKRAHV